MSEFFASYGIFLAKSLTIIGTILITFGGILAMATRNKLKTKEKLDIINLSKHYRKLKDQINGEILDKKELKILTKIEKEKNKVKTNNEKDLIRGRLFVIDFLGDIRASAVENLREAITAILSIANAEDEILVTLESSGGTIHGYGLAASQLQRIRNHGIHLTVAVDKVAASGGYMMACVANKIIAAPFAIIGSIGVIMQLPNFHRLLKKYSVDYEQIMAGTYKRTLSLFGENTQEGRDKMQQEVNEAHQLFQNFIALHRPTVNIENLATGETWYGTKAREIRLIDEILTSDDYLMEASIDRKIFKIVHSTKKSMVEKLSLVLQKNLIETFNY